MDGAPSSGDIAAAIDSVHGQDRWREARAVLRPRRVFGFVRSGLPLRRRLALAAAQGRLVWQTPGAFVVLEPPVPLPAGSTDGAPRSPAPRKGPRLTEAANAHWELLVGLCPALLRVESDALDRFRDEAMRRASACR